MNKPIRVVMIAGEPSGDKLGASLLRGLQALGPVEVSGVGGDLMAQAGLPSLFPMEDLSVMGVFEVLPRIPKLLRRIRETVEHVVTTKPDVLITIDSPDFCLRVAKKVRQVLPDLKIVHYVAPSVWAWRPERATKMAAHIDHVLALLPMEPPLMKAAGMSCDFVGHPVVSENQPSDADKQELIADLGLDVDRLVITLLPGSRRGEIARMTPIFREVVGQIVAVYPDVQFILPAAGPVVDDLAKALKDWSIKPHILNPTGLDPDRAELRKRAAFGISDGAVATSGTVALELAAAGCPMVVAYKANWLTTRMVKKLALIDTANLVNIITDTRHVPEYLFELCTAGNIANGLLSILEGPLREAQIKALNDTMEALNFGNEDQGVYAARSVLQAMENT